MSESERLVGVRGTFEVVRAGRHQAFELGWAESEHFWLSSGGVTAVRWGRQGWVGDGAAALRLTDLGLSGAVGELIDVDDSTCREIVRAGRTEPGTQRVRWEHGAATGTLDLALGMVIELATPDISFRSSMAIADITEPARPGSEAGRRGATFTLEPPPAIGTWEAYLGLTISADAFNRVATAGTATLLSWEQVLEAGRSGGIEVHSTTDAVWDLWDVVGSHEMAPVPMTLDEALRWLRHRRCERIDIRLDLGDEPIAFYCERDGQIDGPRSLDDL